MLCFSCFKCFNIKLSWKTLLKIHDNNNDCDLLFKIAFTGFFQLFMIKVYSLFIWKTLKHSKHLQCISHRATSSIKYHLNCIQNGKCLYSPITL